MRDLRGLLLAFAAAAGIVTPAAAEPALWEVTGGESTVWIFGSVHLLPEGGFALGDSLGDAIGAAERICLEIDPDAQDEAQPLARVGALPQQPAREHRGEDRLQRGDERGHARRHALGERQEHAAEVAPLDQRAGESHVQELGASLRPGGAQHPAQGQEDGEDGEEADLQESGRLCVRKP